MRISYADALQIAELMFFKVPVTVPDIAYNLGYMPASENFIKIIERLREATGYNGTDTVAEQIKPLPEKLVYNSVKELRFYVENEMFIEEKYSAVIAEYIYMETPVSRNELADRLGVDMNGMVFMGMLTSLNRLCEYEGDVDKPAVMKIKSDKIITTLREARATPTFDLVDGKGAEVKRRGRPKKVKQEVEVTEEQPDVFEQEFEAEAEVENAKERLEILEEGVKEIEKESAENIPLDIKLELNKLRKFVMSIIQLEEKIEKAKEIADDYRKDVKDLKQQLENTIKDYSSKNKALTKESHPLIYDEDDDE
jgi:hypothetical protein